MIFIAEMDDDSQWLIEAGSRSEAINRVAERVRFIRLASEDEIEAHQGQYLDE